MATKTSAWGSGAPAIKKDELPAKDGVVAKPLPALAPRPAAKKSFPRFPAKDRGTVASGHSFSKHKTQLGPVYQQLFPQDKEALSPSKLETLIGKITSEATDHKRLSRDRQAWWHDPTGTIVIHDPGAHDRGTIFVPGTKRYFDKQS